MESTSDPGISSSNDSTLPSPLPPSAASPGNAKRPRGRVANVYDAVAGRITLNGALSDSETVTSRSKRRLSATAGRYSSRNPKLAPEEALFRRKNAPVRYAEQDIYWANEDLPESGHRHLPDSNLLRSVHRYASSFYEAAAARLGPRCVVGARTIDERSMDETALLAFGILLEEAGREALGKRGDVVFTDASTEPKAVAKAMQAPKLPRPVSEGLQGLDETPAPQNVRQAKRRKVAKGDSVGDQAS
ncbi:hypothetical protein C8A01DRAFT_39632 [Parachaetomium inaequale]|uniref:Uncharacterized protein n=1 Tax=Parachaetomium inaequale TaxID=2588326 RepID=A0AAN6SN90_9PEZI|nr:hypothetical protein C8A01DRAFT_39632 [Parachaetomium inaequale]